METVMNRTSLVVLTGMVILCFGALGGRLVHLQWVRHDYFSALAENHHERSFFREATRGDIRDRRGNLLATSVPVKTVCADPSLLKGHEAVMARLLAPLLRTNEMALFTLLNRHSHTNDQGEVSDNQYVRLKQKVAIDDWEKVHHGLTNQYGLLTHGKKITGRQKLELQGIWLRAIGTEDDQIRDYPNAHLAAHVLGFIGSREVSRHGITNTFTAGVEGIEATFDEKLRGARGWIKTETEKNGRELVVFREQDVESRPGLNVVLTLEARIQQIVEEELAKVMATNRPVSASAVVVRPRTGEILALATLPDFNPNTPGQYRDASVRRNRVITDTFEPGSTFKTVTLAGALDDGTVKLTTMIDCEKGAFLFAGRVLHDHEQYGVMSVQEIIAKSSNIGTAKVALDMGQERLYEHILDFGFGHRTGLPLTGEALGYVPRLKDWKRIHISRIPIGQGVSATPLQTVMAMCAVANGGELMRPMIVDSLVDERGQVVVRYMPQPVRRVISKQAAKDSTEALSSVVARKGTAEKAALEHYTVAGKTGTAQKVVDGQYSHTKFFASFVGFFPVSNPELCVAVFVDEPSKGGYYGGVVAAPAFRNISERAANFLNIKPDVQPVRGEEATAIKSNRVVVTQLHPR